MLMMRSMIRWVGELTNDFKSSFMLVYDVIVVSLNTTSCSRLLCTSSFKAVLLSLLVSEEACTTLGNCVGNWWSSWEVRVKQMSFVACTCFLETRLHGKKGITVTTEMIACNKLGNRLCNWASVS